MSAASMASGGLERSSCALGCPPGEVEAVVGLDRLHGLPGRFVVVRCSTCGALRTNPRPDPASISPFYPDSYSPYQRPPGPARRSKLVAALNRHFGFDGIGHLVPSIPPSTALEIGCASGETLSKLRDRGWKVCGIEPSPSAAKVAQAAGFDVTCGRIEEVAAPGRDFGLIIAAQVIEHLHDPAAALARLRAWARPDGWLVCSVPDAGSLLFRIFGARWYDLDLPRHLFHFDPRNLTTLLRQAGWSVVSIKYDATMNGMFGSLGYWLKDRLGSDSRIAAKFEAYPGTRSAIKALMKPLALLLAMVRQSGRMIVSARAA